MTATTLRRLIVIGLIVLWEALPRSGLIPELFLPSLSSTLVAGWNEAAEYGHALAVTLYEVAVSMAFACGGGILLGAIVGSLPRPRVLIMPMVSSLYAVPLVILYPVFTVWLGIGSESKIAFAVALWISADHALDRRRHPDHRSAIAARRAEHGRDA